ncbi:MAG: hypothetical protein QXN55_00560 [Candidatus Nitrosotenuis sp.]
MKVGPFLIQQFASFLLSNDTFERLKAVVERQNDKNLTGPEKRHAALQEIKEIGLDLANFAINVGIELAVLYFNMKAGNSINKH